MISILVGVIFLLIFSLWLWVMRSAGGTEIPVEHIPDGDKVSRLVFYPFMYTGGNRMLMDNVFTFPSNRGGRESLVWSRYAPTNQDVHNLGLNLTTAKQAQNPERVIQYDGFIFTKAGQIRSIKTAKGHGLFVVHVPAEGKHHAEVGYQPTDSAAITKLEKGELKLALHRVFSALVPAPTT